jgi:hypothetical protein
MPGGGFWHHAGMSAGPVVGVCQNCGAPLQRDQGGNCTWCHAHIRVDPPPVRYVAYHDDHALVPDDVDDCSSSSPFVYLMLASLGLLSTEPVVQEYTSASGLHGQIRALSTAVSAAGVRVRDGGLLKDSFDQNLDVYTPAEIWTFDLAADVIAMLGAVTGLPGKTRAQIADNIKSLDWNEHRHTWKKDLKKAGEGVGEFRALRAGVPRHAHG